MSGSTSSSRLCPFTVNLMAIETPSRARRPEGMILGLLFGACYPRQLNEPAARDYQARLMSGRGDYAPLHVILRRQPPGVSAIAGTLLAVNQRLGPYLVERPSSF